MDVTDTGEESSGVNKKRQIITWTLFHFLFVSVKKDGVLTKPVYRQLAFSPVCKRPEHPDSTVDNLQDILDIDRTALLVVR
jgi:hypothetical protein